MGNFSINEIARNGYDRLKRHLLIGFTLAIFTAGVSLFVTNLYTSEVRILPKDPRSGGSGLGALAAAAATFGLGGGGTEDAGTAYVDILKSRRVAEGLLGERYQFEDKGWYFGRWRRHEESLLGYLRLESIDKGVVAVKGLLNVQRDPKSGLITVSATTPSPGLSQQLVQGATRRLEEFIMVHSQSQAGARAEFARKRLAEANAEYLQAEDQLRKFLVANRNYAVSADPEVRLSGSRLEAELQLRRQLVSTLAISQEQALLDQKDSTPILNILDPGQLPTEKSKPARGRLVILVFLFGTLGSLGWQHRAWLKARLVAES